MTLDQRHKKATSARSLIVSIHDVAPETLPRVREVVEKLESWGVNRFCLLVVPNYHETGPLCDDPEAVRWLHGREACGDEIVLHGYSHSRPRRATDTALDLLATEFCSKNEAEFYRLGPDEAAAKLRLGAEILGRVGFKPRGFVAPSWIFSRGTVRALKERGFRYMARRVGLIDFTNRVRIRSACCVWSTWAPVRGALSPFWVRLRLRRLRRKPVLRVDVHPPDLEFPVVARQIRGIVQDALSDRRCSTNQEVLAWGKHSV